jgi:hypothetical protein
MTMRHRSRRKVKWRRRQMRNYEPHGFWAQLPDTFPNIKRSWHFVVTKGGSLVEEGTKYTACTSSLQWCRREALSA